MNSDLWDQRIQRYARATFQAAELADFRALAEADIAADLRVAENHVTAALTSAGGVVTLPADYEEMDTVAVAATGGWRPLRPTTRVMAESRYSGSGTAAVYVEEGAALTTFPSHGDGDVEVSYWRNPGAVGVASHPVAAKHPSVYLQAALVHANGYLKDYAAESAARTSYFALVESANNLYESRRFAGGGML